MEETADLTTFSHIISPAFPVLCYHLLTAGYLRSLLSVLGSLLVMLGLWLTSLHSPRVHIPSHSSFPSHITSSPIPSANGRFLRNGTEWEEVNGMRKEWECWASFSSVSCHSSHVPDASRPNIHIPLTLLPLSSREERSVITFPSVPFPRRTR